MTTALLFALGVLIFAIGIGISIAWHELGHFLTARWFGIKVPEFMVGFGKTIWSVKRGETEYGLKLLPIGGYVRMIGMIPPAPGETLGRTRRTGPFQGLIDDVRAQSAMDVRPEDAHRQFYLRSPWKRIVVMAAGPIMNLILAIMLFAVLLMGIGLPTGTTTTVSLVNECVISNEQAAQGVTECVPGAPPSPAAAAGFLPGDVITAVNGRAVTAAEWLVVQEAIRGSVDVPIQVTVLRGGQSQQLVPTPILNQLPSLEDREQFVDAGFLGLSPVTFYERQSVGVVFTEIGDVVSRTTEAIIALPSRVPGLFGAAFLGEERDVEGPIGVVGVSRIGGEVLAQEDFTLAEEATLLLSLLAAVNISLFLFNLLPIPPLDGGQIFPAVWEAVKKRIWRLRGRPDPGPVDVAKLMPVAYVVAMLFIVWFGVLLVADVVNPIRFFG